AGDDGDAPAQVGGLGALLIVEVPTGGAHLVVEEVDPLAHLLADVAGARVLELRLVPALGVREAPARLREGLGLGGDEHGLQPLLTDARALEHGRVRFPRVLPPLLLQGPREHPLLGPPGARHLPGGDQEPIAQLSIDHAESGAVLDQRLQHTDALLNVFGLHGLGGPGTRTQLVPRALLARGRPRDTDLPRTRGRGAYVDDRLARKASWRKSVG